MNDTDATMAKLLKERITELIDFYCELDEVGYETFLNMFHDELKSIEDYHQKQIDKVKNLGERLGGQRSAKPDILDLNFGAVGGGVPGGLSDDTINFDFNSPIKAIDFSGASHSSYFFDNDRNI